MKAATGKAIEQLTNEDGNVLRKALSPHRLHLIILPTEQCNFRCKYCYEDFKVGKMAKFCVEGINKLISQRLPNTSNLTISWFGGEPLLALDIISNISHHIKNEIE